MLKTPDEFYDYLGCVQLRRKSPDLTIQNPDSITLYALGKFRLSILNTIDIILKSSRTNITLAVYLVKNEWSFGGIPLAITGN